MRTRDRRSTRMLATGLFAVAGLGLAGCGEEEPVVEEPVVEEPVTGEATTEAAPEPTTEGEMATGEMAYEGPYDQAFVDDMDTYMGQGVTLTGEVNETITPDAFTIGPDVDPLLVIETNEDIPPVDPGQQVQVTGTVEQVFDIVAVEEDYGIDLDDELFVAYESEPYLVADTGEVVSGG